MDDLIQDLNLLYDEGYKYIFVDEATLMDDFIDSAALLSDLYVPMGMRIVLSGTDSLGFWFARDNELYDRVRMIHTTFIPFREYSRLLGIDSIDEYIRYGGLLSRGELAFDDGDANSEYASFRDDESTRRYIDTAICKNIQHSLTCFEYGHYFGPLRELYESGELTSAINRVIEDMNHRFLVDVLIKDFVSSDLDIASHNLKNEHDLSKRTRILDLVDRKAITEKLMKILVFTQPGMRYCQAQALVYSLIQDDTFALLREDERSFITERILEEVRGRMHEDIILLEATKALGKQYEVFKYRFTSGEFDMVIFDRENSCVAAYEIKHSNVCVHNQARHLLDESSSH